MIALTLLAVAMLIALALWWRLGLKAQKHARAARVRDHKRPLDNYHCVELRYRSDACDAVKRIGAKRFLPGEAPDIPLPGCDAKCSCRYVHHEDRRHNDRRNPVAYHPPASAGERRTKRDRRRPAKTPFRPKIGR